MTKPTAEFLVRIDEICSSIERLRSTKQVWTCRTYLKGGDLDVETLKSDLKKGLEGPDVAPTERKCSLSMKETTKHIAKNLRDFHSGKKLDRHQPRGLPLRLLLCQQALTKHEGFTSILRC